MKVVLIWGIALAPCAALSKSLLSSSFRLQYTPSARLSDAEIGVLEEATLSVLQEALLGNDEFIVNQTQVIFQLQKADEFDTVSFRASTVSRTKQQEDWQAFVEATLLPSADVIFRSATKSSELAFLTGLLIEATNSPREHLFTRLDWILLAASILLFGIFAYLMYLNYRDWKRDRPPRNIGEEKEEQPLDPLQKPSVAKEGEKELNEIMERFTATSDANTSPTSSTKENLLTPPKPKPYNACNDQDACSLEAALSGLSDIVHNVLRPEDAENPSVAGTTPSNATSDVFDMIDDRPSPPSHAAEWMKHVRISVLDSSSSLASRDSLKHALVGSSSTVYSESELEASDQY